MLACPFVFQISFSFESLYDDSRTQTKHVYCYCFWAQASMVTNMPGTGLEAGSAKTTTDIFQLLFPRVAKTKKVIMFLRSPDCQKDLCRGSIPPFLYSEFNSRLPIRGQTHGWHTILAPAHSDDNSELFKSLPALSTAHPFPS